LGTITAFYGAVVSASQTDCKKLLAYSTISHCGFMFITVGLNNLYLSLTYLYLHGFFKALTFFCVGNIVKTARGYQDTRRMGQIFMILPVESLLLIVCAINLGALPFTVGYFYKYLFQVITINSNLLLLLLPFILVAMLSSIIYVFRLVFYSLFDIQKGNNSSFDYYFNPDFEDEDYSSSTTSSIFFIFLLLCLSIYIYFFYLLFYKNFLIIALNNNNTDVLAIVSFLTKSNVEYFHFFYSFFGVIFFILIKISCRAEFSSLKSNYFFLNFFIFIFFLQFFFLLL